MSMTDPLFSVADQVVLVSGGSRGIGLGLAQGFAERGAKVIITGRDAESLSAAAKKITGTHPATWVACNVSVPQQCRDCIDQVFEQHGHVDTLLNVAGVNRRQRIETFTESDYDFVLDTNLKGPFFLSQRYGQKCLEQRRGGNIINIDSLSSRAPFKGVSPYAISKAGLQMLTRSLALEWGPHGIRANTLAPGFILTDLTQKLWSDPGMQAWGQASTPLKRMGLPQDLVGTAIFLASPASAFITGQAIYVDGGFTAGQYWPIPLS
jgi:gluconate 5-dehydrogenase